MNKNALLLFKKPTDAVGANRGFIYQYLKTLNLWLDNYRNNRDLNIYCEVEDDIKEIEVRLKVINYTQLKCYSSVLSLKNEDVQKSLYNFFILFLIYKEYSGTFSFESNTSISNRDKLLSSWALEAGRLDLHPDLVEECKLKTREILISELEKAKTSKETAFQRSRREKEDKISKESNIAMKEKLNIEIEESKKKLTEYLVQVEALKTEIMDDKQLGNFVNRIQWDFKKISAEHSMKELESEALVILRDILRADKDPNIYFCRLLTEVSKKATSDSESDRMLNNELLLQILKETDEEINERISKELMGKWNESLTQGFTSVHDHLDELGQTIERKLDLLSGQNIQESASNDYAYVDLPHKEIGEIQDFLHNEQNDYQSKLEKKIHNMGNVDAEMKESFLEMGTEFRCRYLIYLEELQLSSYKAYQAVKNLEVKVQKMCTRHTMQLSKISIVDSNEGYIELEDKLESLLEEFNFELIKNGIKVDSDIVTGQMFHMAAKCSLKWHKEAAIG